MTNGLKRGWPAALFALLACLFLWRVLLAGQVFVPADLLRWVAPWSASYTPEQRPPWNPLMYDSVGQFYPWRKFAGEEIRAGRIPLWNPYQFCGTPFVANSQSAVLYPGNVLFYLLPAERAAGPTVLLHLLLAALFTAAFLRALGVGSIGRAFGGTAFAFSTWQVSWLHLPTFLDTSCWLPLVLLATLRLFAPGPARARHAVALGFAAGMALLAGHLQIAFYVLLAAGLLALWLTICRVRDSGWAPALGRCGMFAAGWCAALALAAPQLLPSIELSRRSHRAAPPSAQGYEAYTNYTIQPRALATLLFPDFYGNPARPEAPYFGTDRSGRLFNYAEGALYVGLPTLLLAAYALASSLRRPGNRAAEQPPTPAPLTGWLGVLVLLSLLMALGTGVDALLYFYMPGFGQSGSPGRALMLWAFGLASLGAIGLDTLAREDRTALGPAAAAVCAVALLGGAAVALGLGAAEPAREAQAWQPEIARQVGLLMLSVGALLGMGALRRRHAALAAAPLALLIVDLLANGINYNPTASPSDVYPTTPAIRLLVGSAGHDRIAPVNRNWSFAGPHAALPPDGAMVFRLRDVQGYDSLFPGQYKAFMNRVMGQDASPPEVGNMVFAKVPSGALVALAGVRVLVSPDPSSIPTSSSQPVDGMYVVPLPDAPGRATLRDRDQAAAGAVAWLQDDPCRVRLRATATTAATLTLSDQFYPGWHASISGRPVPIARANEVFRGVRLPAGVSDVLFAYRPAAFQVGLYLLLAALMGGSFTVAAHMAARSRRD